MSNKTLTRLFNGLKMNGQYIDLAYGNYKFDQIGVLPGSIMSLIMPPHSMVTLYSSDDYSGTGYVINNFGDGNLNVPGFNKPFEFPYDVRSLKIDCSCKTKDPRGEVIFRILKGDVKREDQVEISYTFYQVIPEPRQGPNDAPSPFNPTILIIPDFATDITMYECLQSQLAYHRFSSIALNLRGVDMSYSAKNVQYSDIIQDFRYIAKQLDQYQKKPIVLGHGIGGAIAQLWAITYKSELRNLILINSAPIYTYSKYNLVQSSINDFINNKLTKAQLAPILVNATYNYISEDAQIPALKEHFTTSILSTDATTLKRLFTQNPDRPTLAVAPKYVLIPTLILASLRDDMVDVSGSAALSNLIKCSKIRKFDSSHAPQFTANARVVQTIIDYLLPGDITYTDFVHPRCCR